MIRFVIARSCLNLVEFVMNLFKRHLSFLAVDSFDKMLHSGQFIGIDARRRKRQGLRIGLTVLVDACELD